MRTLAVTALVACAAAATSCRRPVVMDSVKAAHIPASLAVKQLKDLLPTAEVVNCNYPRARFVASDLSGWVVEENKLEFLAKGKGIFGFSYSDVESVQVDRLGQHYQVRIFTKTWTDPKKEHYFIAWREEEPARQAAELIEALRQNR